MLLKGIRCKCDETNTWYFTGLLWQISHHLLQKQPRQCGTRIIVLQIIGERADMRIVGPVDRRKRTKIVISFFAIVCGISRDLALLEKVIAIKTQLKINLCILYSIIPCFIRCIKNQLMHIIKHGIVTIGSSPSSQFLVWIDAKKKIVIAIKLQ